MDTKLIVQLMRQVERLCESMHYTLRVETLPAINGYVPNEFVIITSYGLCIHRTQSLEGLKNWLECAWIDREAYREAL